MTDSTSTIEVLGPGVSGDPVRQLQARLMELGYHPGAADGVFGPLTEAAVREYQTAVGLTPDGLAGPLTHAKLFPSRSPDLAGINAVARLMQFRDEGKYALGGGGVNPNSNTPWTWVGSVYGADCIGAVCWALGIPRSTPQFPEYEGDIGVDSALMDAGLIPGGAGGRKFFAPVDAADVVPGHLVAFPSIRAHELWPWNEAAHGFKPQSRVRIGHIGFVVGWDGLTDPFQLNVNTWNGDAATLITLECRASTPAIRLGRNVSFRWRDAYARGGDTWTNPAWECKYMRYVGAAGVAR